MPYEPSQPHQIALQNSESRSVKVEGPDGKPVAGARIEARLIFFTGGTGSAEIPASLASPIAVTTGPDGTATINYLRARDRLVAARVTADSIGEQDLPVTEETRPGVAATIFAIKLKETSRLSGRIVDAAGSGVAGQSVEIWSLGSVRSLVPSVVGFKNGPVRTGADGTFQTPTNLLIGSSCRVAVRESGKEPIISDWLAITDQPLTLAPLELRAFRSITGRVIDRNGKAVAGIEVFQSGNGSDRTAVRTDSSGRFALGGFQNGTVFLFARGEGFRFHGQMLKPGDREINVELTRLGERPARNLTKLADPIPIEESRGLARRIMERWWNLAVAKGDEDGKSFAAQFLIPADPVVALQKIGAIKFPTEESRARLQSIAARVLARTDFEEGETVAESIADPAIRAGTLARLADLVPGAEKQRKLGILERALIQAKAANSPADFVYHVGEVAGRLLELGEIKKAKQLFAEGVRHARDFKDVSFKRRSFAALLARIDLPGALEMAKQLADDEPYGSLMVSSVAFGLPWNKPVEAERFLSLYPPASARTGSTPTDRVEDCNVRPWACTETARDAAGRTQFLSARVLRSPGLQGARRANHERSDSGGTARARSRPERRTAYAAAIWRTAAGDCRGDRPGPGSGGDVASCRRTAPFR